MKTAFSILTENKYLILLNVPKETNEKADALRRRIADKYKIRNEGHGRDILLARFDSLAAREALLIQALKQVVKHVDPFIVSFKGIESIPSHSYKMPATSKVALMNLIKHIKKITKAIKAEETKPFFNQDFGITLFSKLKPFEFEALQPELAQMNLSFQCIANEIKLLKSEKSSPSGWQPVTIFQLKKETQMSQSVLF